MTPSQQQTALEVFLQTAAPGQRLLYHIGNLAHDLVFDDRIRKIRDLAWATAVSGACDLIQQKNVGSSAISYWIVKRLVIDKRPTNKKDRRYY